MTIEEAKSILLNTAWLGTDKDREKTEEAVKVLIAEIEQESHNQTKVDVLTDINNKYRDTLDMAIKALEQEPCEDCISRENLLKKCVYAPIAPVIKGDSVHYEDIVFARDIINAEPIQQEPKAEWIPVSERLPEEGQDVLFCDIDNDVMIGYHVKGRPKTHFTQSGSYEDMKNVIAWCPLPELYKEG